MPWLLVPPLVIGISLSLWTYIGCTRFVWQRTRARTPPPVRSPDRRLDAADVAVVIPAHNEELCIGATVRSVLRVVAAEQVHVIADGCDDDTALVARSLGVNVLTLDPARGKAGGIEAVLERFQICRRFRVLLIVDADTLLDEHYLERGLRLLDEDGYAAVAGYAYASWRPNELSSIGRFLVSYRSRIYVIAQWMRYGQTWWYTNVSHIVPGFASMYRTAVLPKMDLNPPGLIIEDFNMTFELRRRRLGKVNFEPKVFGTTQDPDNLPDYYRQVTRWSLGFWQTLRRHGLWPSWFSCWLSFFVLEVLLGSVVLMAAVLALVFLAVAPLSGGIAVRWGWYLPEYLLLSPFLTPVNLLFFMFVPDYLLTCVSALWLRRPSMLIYGFGFLFVRLVDAVTVWRTLPMAWRTRSSGRWTSPTRRPVEVSDPDGPLSARPADPGAEGSEPVPGASAGLPRTSSERTGVEPSPGCRAVLCDALLLGGVLVTATLAVRLGVPALVVILATLFLFGLAVSIAGRDPVGTDSQRPPRVGSAR